MESRMPNVLCSVSIKFTDTRRQPQAQGLIPSVIGFCKPAQSLPVLPKARSKPALTNIPFWHKTGTFFPLHKQRAAYPPAKGMGRRVYTKNDVFRIQKEKGNSAKGGQQQYRPGGIACLV